MNTLLCIYIYISLSYQHTLICTSIFLSYQRTGRRHLKQTNLLERQFNHIIFLNFNIFNIHISTKYINFCDISWVDRGAFVIGHGGRSRITFLRAGSGWLMGWIAVWCVIPPKPAIQIINQSFTYRNIGPPP